MISNSSRKQTFGNGVIFSILKPTTLIGQNRRMKGRTLDLARIVRATRYSISGLRNAVVGEAAFRQELLAALFLTPVAVWLGDTGVERALLIGVLLLVLIVELLNSAIETTVDRVGTEFHDLSGRAKDLGSAAVFISLISVPIVWALVLIG